MPTAAGTRYLAIFLEDHLAASTAVLELVRRGAGEYRGSELGSFLERLVADIEADRKQLERLAAAIGTRPNQLKEALAWGAEKAGRLKLNGHLLSPSPLSPLVELEAIAIGVHGNLLLWRALEAQYLEQTPAGVRPADLIERAERQLAEIERHRLAAAAAAFET
jgi:hypothetical protein